MSLVRAAVEALETQRSNEQLDVDIREELERAPSVNANRIGITADHGLVVLNGHVLGETWREAAVKATLRVEGVHAVVDEMKVRTSVSCAYDANLACEATAAFRESIAVTGGRVFTKLVERNTTIPTEKKETFTTGEDNQSAVTIKVYQGERPMAADNRLLGEFNLEGIPQARMGVPRVEVSFNLDANGIVQVSAKDKGTGKEQTIKIESSGGLTKDEIERMQRDADVYADDDRKKRELADDRNAEQRVYQLEKSLEENKSRLSEAGTAAVRSAIAHVDQVKLGDDAAENLRAIEELQQTGQAMSERLYAATAASASKTNPNGSAATSSGGRRGNRDDEVIDVDFEEKT